MDIQVNVWKIISDSGITYRFAYGTLESSNGRLRPEIAAYHLADYLADEKIFLGDVVLNYSRQTRKANWYVETALDELDGPRFHSALLEKLRELKQMDTLQLRMR